MRHTRWVGIDIGSACVKVVVLHRRGVKLEVAGAGVADLPRGGEPNALPDPEGVAGAIRQALSAAGARAGDAAVAIPQQQASIRLVRLPGHPSEHLARAAVLEGTRDMPFPPGAVLAGAHQHPGENAEETAAVVAAARSDLADLHRKAVAAAGMRAAWMGVSSLAVVAAAGNTGDRPWILMDVGASATTVCLCSGAMVRASRSALLGGAHLTEAFAVDLGCDWEAAEDRKRSQGLDALPRGDAGSGPAATEEWLSQLVAEARMLLSAAVVQGQPLPAVVRLAGGGGLLSGLAPYLERALGLPVEPLSTPALSGPKGANAGQLAAAYGMALAASGDAQTVDLLAQETVRTGTVQRQRRRGWAIAAAALLLFGGGGAGAHRSWREHRRAAHERSDAAHEAAVQREAVKKLDSQRQEFAAQAASLRRALRPKPAWVDVVDALALAAPSGVWVTGIELERGKPLLVRGTAIEATGAARFVTSLMASPLLDQVQLSFANGAQLGSQHVTNFGISALVKGNLPEKRAATTVSRRRRTPPVKGIKE